MPEDDDLSNVTALRGQSEFERGKQMGRAHAASMSKPQQMVGGLILVLTALAVVGALVRLNVWIWAGR